MKILRSRLTDALSKVAPGLSEGSSVENADSFLFKNNRIITYNDEVSVSVPFECDWEGALRAGPLTKLLAKNKDEELEVTLEDGQLIFQGKGKRAGLKMKEDDASQPIMELGSPEEWYMLPEGFMETVATASFSASTDESKFILMYVCVRDGMVESCDNFRVTRLYLPEGSDELVPGPLLIPAATIGTLLRYQIKQYAITRGWLHFRDEDENSAMFSVRTPADGIVFPNLDRFLNMVEGPSFVFPQELSPALERARIFSPEAKANARDSVEISVETGWMTVTGVNEDGWFQEQVACDYEGDKVEFRINASFLMQILAMDGMTVTLGDKMLKFEGGNMIHTVALMKPTTHSPVI